MLKEIKKLPIENLEQIPIDLNNKQSNLDKIHKIYHES